MLSGLRPELKLWATIKSRLETDSQAAFWGQTRALLVRFERTLYSSLEIHFEAAVGSGLPK